MCVLRKHTSHYLNCLFDIGQIKLRSKKKFIEKKIETVYQSTSDILPAIIGDYQIRDVGRNIDNYS